VGEDIEVAANVGAASQSLFDRLRPVMKPDINIGSIITIMVAVVPLVVNLFVQQAKTDQRITMQVALREQEMTALTQRIDGVSSTQRRDFTFLQNEFNGSQAQIAASMATLNASINDLRDQVINRWNLQQYGPDSARVAK
jgi:hypothetical protein